MGISRLGDSAEDEFLRLTCAQRSETAASGDACFDLEGIKHYVEVKKASKKTLNQVRAVKYLTLVVLLEQPDRAARWFVIPAHIVVKVVSRKRRGQHSENPFESSTLSLGHLTEYEVPTENLEAATMAAILQANSFPALRDAMQAIRDDCREQADADVARVRLLLEESGIGT